MSEKNNALAVQEKTEIQNRGEQTTPGIKYRPATDVVETSKELLVYMDMPGVNKDDVKVKIEKGKLIVDGVIDSSVYKDFEPLYSEYNIGHYQRRFELTNEIDQSKIEAKISDGVLLLTLPKIPEKQPKLIKVN